MRVLRIRQQVGKMGYLTIQHRTPGRYRAIWPRWIRLEKLIQDFGRKIVGRRNLQKFAVVEPNNAEYGLAQPRGALNNRIEQPHVLDRDHRLVGEGREQLYLFLGEGPHS